MLFGTACTFGVLIFNLYKIQITEGNTYLAKAESQYNASGTLEPRRGSIYFLDKYDNKIPAVLNRSYPIIFAVPIEVEDVEKAASVLSEIFSISKATLVKKLSKPKDQYELIETRVLDQQLEVIQTANLPGIYLSSQESRFYPFATLASQVLGFVGENAEDGVLKGRYGLESEYDDQLRGERGQSSLEDQIKPRHGNDLELTIDRNIQARSEEILKKIVDQFDAEGGSVIVQDPKTGKILALANNPTFDPNAFASFPVQNFLNPAVQNIYEPGSVFKVITMASGIDSGAITPQTTYVDTGTLSLNGRTIANWDKKAYGKISMTEVIENSVNTGAAFAVKATGRDTFYRYLQQFGFGKPTNIGLPGEVSGSLRTLEEDTKDINFATASFGQGVSVTPIQLIAAMSAIGNKGVLMQPYLLESNEPRIIRRVIKEETAKLVSQMMVSAVNKAEVAHIPGYKVAGKTGTAQVPARGGYSEELIHTFAGYVPVSDPQFTILFKLDKPDKRLLAGATVVPAFRELAQFILNYYTIPPDSLSQETIDNP